MPRVGHRRRLATNVYEDGSGRRSIIYRDPDGSQRELRFPPDTPIRTMRDEVEKALSLATASGLPKAERDTLAGAVDRLATIEGDIPGWTERRAELRAWLKAVVDGDPLGTWTLRDVDEATCRRVMHGWLKAGVAPKTVRQRRWTLQHLYRVLYGTRVRSPVDDIPPPPKVRRVPTYIAPAHILTVYQHLIEQEQKGLLRDAKTRARFMVRASTGRRPAEIMRAQPDDVNLERREWRVRDAKGGWSPGVYLNDDMLAAWRLFIEADAWGPFNTGSMARVLRTAGWKAGVRPYELRHNVGIAVLDAGQPLDAAGAQLGHRNVQTTRDVYAPIRGSHMQRVSEAIDRRFHGWAVPATVPVTSGEKRGDTGRNARPEKAADSRRKRAKVTGKSRRKAGGSA